MIICKCAVDRYDHIYKVAVFHCITVYKQPPPSLHRQDYRAV